MKKILLTGMFVLFTCLLLPFVINAQATGNAAVVTAQKATGENDLFGTDEILELTLAGNIKEVLNDRAVNSITHPLQLLYKKANGEAISIPVEVKTRGHFRKLKTNCVYPPLLLNFSKSEALNNSVFEGMDKLKLVMPCTGDEYVIREWLVYKLYNLVTAKSFKTRLVKVTLHDAVNKKTSASFYGLLLESEKQMAKRNGLISVEKKLMKPEQTDRDAFLTMSVFEYLIGNTDWSVQYMQNVKLIAVDSMDIPIPVAYDFDHSGLVNAPYAKPTEELQLLTVKDRRYRGYCITDMKNFDETIALFNNLKSNIYSTYTNCALLDPKYVKSTLKYLDDFYNTINNAKAMKRDFGYPCDNTGTGNIVIKGLKED